MNRGIPDVNPDLIYKPQPKVKRSDWKKDFDCSVTVPDTSHFKPYKFGKTNCKICQGKGRYWKKVTAGRERLFQCECS